MGIIKLLLITLTCLVVGFGVGIFIVRNDTLISVQTLLSATPLEITVGKLSGSSFLLGILLGLFMCIAYIVVQYLELQAARRKVVACEKQIESLRSSSYKDMP